MSPATSRPRALVTGASAGIGRVYAVELSRRGYDLVLVARRRERLEKVRAELHPDAAAELLVADLCDGEGLASVERCVRATALELLVNNAGIGAYRPFVELADDQLHDLLALDVDAVVRLTHAALPGMVARRSGGIINVASLLALSGSLPPNPLPFRATYAGAKALLVTFSQALAGELAASGVQVQVCLPGLVATEFHSVQGFERSRQLPPAMSAEDVVTASLSALDRGEVTCVPGLEDPTLLDRLAEANRAILLAANKPTLAARYAQLPKG